MREIKFRGKAIYNSCWVYGLLRRRKGLNHDLIEELDGLGHDVDPKTVGQYIGLKDKNGKGRWSKEIYEGDIVEIIDGTLKGERLVIKYQEEWGSFIADQGEGGLLFFLAKDKRWCNKNKLIAKEIKVIGNKFENPELLKEKK